MVEKDKFSLEVASSVSQDRSDAPGSFRSPENDPYWKQTAEFICAEHMKPEQVLAPEPFALLMPGIRTYREKDGWPSPISGKYDWFVIHKDWVDRLDPGLLTETLLAFEPQFANDVFCVYGRVRRKDQLDMHLPALIERIRHHVSKLCDSTNQRFAPPKQLGNLERYSVYLGDHTALTHTVFGHKLFVDTRDLSLTPHLLLDGYWEMWIAAAVRKIVKPGMQVVEIGANCGYYSVLLADAVGPSGHVYAFEPNIRLFELVFRNLEINGFRERSTCFQKAVGDQNGKAAFFIFEKHLGSSSLLDQSGPAALLHDKAVQVEIETTSLDKALSSVGRIDFMKIDAEGAEPIIFQGAKDILRRNPQLQVVMELAPTFFGTLEKTKEFLDQLRSMGLFIQRIFEDSTISSLEDAALLKYPHSELYLCFNEPYRHG